MPYQLVCFDLGRVLVRICDGWSDAFSRAGVKLERDLDPQTRARLLEGVYRIEVGDGEVAAFCSQAAQVLGISCDAVTRMWDGYTLGEFEGVGELLDELHAAKLVTACLSNTNHVHWQLMMSPTSGNYPNLARLTHRIASHEIRARKPEAPAFEYVERTTGTRPEQIVFFDDLADNVEAARARGWTAVLVPRCENPIPLIRSELARLGVLAPVGL